MLRKILTSDIVVGMYIHQFCGAWINHPSWKGSFEVKDVQDIVRIQHLTITEVWVDLSKGRPPSAASSIVMTCPASPVPVSLDEELSEALKICVRAKTAVIAMFNDARLGRAISPKQSSELVAEITDSILRHPHALLSLSRLKTSDDYTYMHSVAVCILMIALARQLKLAPEQVKEAGIAGLMHDVGKMMISNAILDKAGKLTAEEFNRMKDHPEEGMTILERTASFGAEVLDVCLHHHEKIDGTGYPHGLAGDHISLFAKMGAVCDVYDAVTSERPYKKGWGPAHSIREMATWKGHFDETVFRTFVKTVGIYPIGALVSLKSGRLGVVMEQNSSSLLTPKVKVFMLMSDKTPLPHEIIDLASIDPYDKIVEVESAEKLGISNTEVLWSGIPWGTDV
ncbi:MULTISPECIES: HD-GYP domain-containing protein [unclassified Pseudomonas]|uniref:HD-GYP domain-containing protein n=1 Tax=unclassified Pseudomonas TaxID=196821 RepID=UPI002AC9B435|nr:MULTISPECIES: HD-GYP domain-containing protein [unclassified Pseudomonas]MEB0043464.1 HD-GYP domain-containing protein [Pseudomonas sp. MH10]MEB0080232.1 HD-GYP domain-containing protein [Pseudomonas sp. MH10out]MEB0093825.1 HD-GYP domain-containing protein [Pseudomonas sp. CCI4.2]MEB0104401.1 HD-GYP domain-containing protein [Pseudomonas sp. CCI3.2]MEB0123664.1 HD-GYP domain-containing protein [Pseudomonas sp. CCI1.2]